MFPTRHCGPWQRHLPQLHQVFAHLHLPQKSSRQRDSGPLHHNAEDLVVALPTNASTTCTAFKIWPRTSIICTENGPNTSVPLQFGPRNAPSAPAAASPQVVGRRSASSAPAAARPSPAATRSSGASGPPCLTAHGRTGRGRPSRRFIVTASPKGHGTQWKAICLYRVRGDSCKR